VSYERYAQSLSSSELERELAYAEARISGSPMQAALLAERERRVGRGSEAGRQ